MSVLGRRCYYYGQICAPARRVCTIAVNLGAHELCARRVSLRCARNGFGDGLLASICVPFDSYDVVTNAKGQTQFVYSPVART
jgi:hypothetical protein